MLSSFSPLIFPFQYHFFHKNFPEFVYFSRENINYSEITKFLDSHFCTLVKAATSHSEKNRHLINVNFPGGTKEFAGVKRTIPSKAPRYKDEIVTFKSPIGKDYVWIKGNLCENNDPQLLTDISAIRAGYVSVSAINVLPEDSGIEITF